jgi:hypothetical protein
MNKKKANRPGVKRVKNTSEILWDEMGKEREDGLLEAVDKASLGNGLSMRDFRWLARYENAVVAFEEGRPRKLINLEKSLGIVWNNGAYQRTGAEVHAQAASPATVEAFVVGVCKEIKRQKRPAWLRWF